jgi:hypothetical protein
MSAAAVQCRLSSMLRSASAMSNRVKILVLLWQKPDERQERPRDSFVPRKGSKKPTWGSNPILLQYTRI